jgi:hypothetical protein
MMDTSLCVLAESANKTACQPLDMLSSYIKPAITVFIDVKIQPCHNASVYTVNITKRNRIALLFIILTLLTGCQSPHAITSTPSLQEPVDKPPAHNSEGKDDSTMTPPKTYLIGAYYYPWYSPERHWDSGYRGTPVLGEYDSADPNVINQHITWAREYGIDFFAMSWWGINSFEDKVIHGPFLDIVNHTNFQFAILYESAGQLKIRDGKIDLDNNATRQQLVSDFEYLADTAFIHPNTLTVDGRPVIFLYLTRTFVGDVPAALSAAKAAAIARGSKEPFIVGDEVYWQYPDQNRIGFFDGVTAYNMHTSVPNIAEGFAENVDRQYRAWAKIAAKQDTLFIPNILPGFDDTAVRPQANHPVIPRSVELFTAQYYTAKELISSDHGIIMITSWNEWHEDTSIEPAEEEGTAYLEALLNTQLP